MAGVRLTPEERAELLAPGPPVACDGVPPRALGNFAQMIRAEAAREAASPSLDNLPETRLSALALLHLREESWAPEKSTLPASGSTLSSLTTPSTTSIE